ncbi:SDR family NAD(P)-dependent oxidoreductase [Devosia albogilva]|uniref:SDR family NAD(P)-dependent oxidoreductase n=1 Tax=Devosia albogilva TaxID=429726 RepID=A0ABW5QPA7_9HYPH
MPKLVVVITGASSGNGRAIARRFARDGAAVVLVARDRAALDETAQECVELGGTALPVVADMGDHAAVARVGSEAVERFGRIDVWVNCAAILHFGRIDDTPPEIIEQVLRTNVLGYFNGAQVAIEHFRERRAGTLINISSVLAVTAQPYAAAYVASKAAIRAMSEAVRQEVADMPRIHVSTVLPYAIDTPIYQRAANYSGRLPQPVVPRYSPQTVADAVVRLTRHPRREVYVGKVGALAAWAKGLLPRSSDAVVRAAIHTIELARPGGAPTQGNAFQPIHDQWKVSGGWRSPAKTPLLAPALVAFGGLALLAALRRVGKNRRR